MEKDKFFDNVLIKLKRQYKKDELVSALTKQLSEKDLEIGKLLSEIDYLKSGHENLENKLKSHKDLNKEAKIEVRKEGLYIVQTERIKQQNEKIKSLKRTNEDLICQLIKAQNGR